MRRPREGGPGPLVATESQDSSNSLSHRTYLAPARAPSLRAFRLVHRGTTRALHSPEPASTLLRYRPATLQHGPPLPFADTLLVCGCNSEKTNTGTEPPLQAFSCVARAR
jgi:hypothetical protein